MPSSLYLIIRKQSGDTATNIFGRFKAARVNAKLSKGNLTKHKELDKVERRDGNTIDPDKMAGDKFLALAFLE